MSGPDAPAGRRLLHFSEDPSIERFVPHVPPTNPDHPPAVWAIDDAHSPLYWFPRDCPRVAAWAVDAAERAKLRELLRTTATRVHAVELAWLDRIRTAELFVYELPAEHFRPWQDADGQWIADVAVEPLAVRPVGDLLARHVDAGIELRLTPDLWSLRDVVVGSGLPFSLVRTHLARPPRPETPRPGFGRGTALSVASTEELLSTGVEWNTASPSAAAPTRDGGVTRR